MVLKKSATYGILKYFYLDTRGCNKTIKPRRYLKRMNSRFRRRMGRLALLESINEAAEDHMPEVGRVRRTQRVCDVERYGAVESLIYDHLDYEYDLYGYDLNYDYLAW